MGTVWYHLYVESKNTNNVVNITKKKTHRCREQTSGYQWGEEGGEGQYRGREEKGYYGIVWNYVCETLKIVKHYRILKIFHSVKKTWSVLCGIFFFDIWRLGLSQMCNSFVIKRKKPFQQKVLYHWSIHMEKSKIKSLS